MYFLIFYDFYHTGHFSGTLKVATIWGGGVTGLQLDPSQRLVRPDVCAVGPAFPELNPLSQLLPFPLPALLSPALLSSTLPSTPLLCSLLLSHLFLSPLLPFPAFPSSPLPSAVLPSPPPLHYPALSCSPLVSPFPVCLLLSQCFPAVGLQTLCSVSWPWAFLKLALAGVFTLGARATLLPGAQDGP